MSAISARNWLLACDDVRFSNRCWVRVPPLARPHGRAGRGSPYNACGFNDRRAAADAGKRAGAGPVPVTAPAHQRLSILRCIRHNDFLSRRRRLCHSRCRGIDSSARLRSYHTAGHCARTGEVRGTIIVSVKDHTLDFVVGKGRVIRYRISVGRQGFGWTGTVTVAAKVTWPWWRPPPEMRARDPRLQPLVPPGPLNPLGARALYLYNGGRDSLFPHPWDQHGRGNRRQCYCRLLRMTNRDVMELFPMVPIGTKVIVK